VLAEPWVLPELTEGATTSGREVSGEKTRGLGGWRRGGSGSDIGDEGSHTPMGRGDGRVEGRESGVKMGKEREEDV